MILRLGKHAIAVIAAVWLGWLWMDGARFENFQDNSPEWISENIDYSLIWARSSAVCLVTIYVIGGIFWGFTKSRK